MSTHEIHYCDICEMDGYEEKKAIARYWDDTGTKYDVCTKHLKIVKQSGLEWEVYDKDWES